MQKDTTVLQGKNLINGQWVGSEDTAASVDLASLSFAQANLNQVEEACQAARAAFRSYSQKSRAERAAFLNKIADEIDVLGDQITDIGTRETGLPEARLIGERGRTTGQLRMFAGVIGSKDYLDIRIDQALPDRQPMPRPDIRLTHRALGPVVVFGASNFPLAFSAAGGDTASALAAGCPVIVKGHSAHAGTAELVGQAIANAIQACNMPRGTFQLLQGSGRKIGGALVQHPEITAVGFTGSTAGGRVLYDMCHSRPKPIPFYGELGSVNPVFCLPQAMAQRAISIGKDWAASLSMGAGQFCTNPGVMLAIKGDSFTALQNAAVTLLNAGPEQKMLTDSIHASYHDGISELAANAEEITDGQRSRKPRHGRSAAFRVNASTWLETPALHEEVFGAAGIFVECDSEAQMLQVAQELQGQLTITLQMDQNDTTLAKELLPIVEEKAGRILCNGFPTGVEVSSAMMHGGPYPASTDSRSTSVGTLAIARWLRPLAFQNFPASLLDADL
ncbi:MAG: aldehyde dehydrogenase (NADP(+)) [Paracoccaceae bacterium]|nr:aldehyde dehydrogenase (NADP(+)) [Paracoccaceae bacterium]